MRVLFRGLLGLAVLMGSACASPAQVVPDAAITPPRAAAASTARADVPSTSAPATLAPRAAPTTGVAAPPTSQVSPAVAPASGETNGTAVEVPAPAPVGQATGAASGSADAFAGCVPPQQARPKVGTQACVEGRVTRLNYARNSQGSPTFLDFGESFTAVVWIEDRASFPGIDGWRGRLLRVAGTVEEFRGKPQIILRRPDQLKQVG